MVFVGKKIFVLTYFILMHPFRNTDLYNQFLFYPHETMLIQSENSPSDDPAFCFAQRKAPVKEVDIRCSLS